MAAGPRAAHADQATIAGLVRDAETAGFLTGAVVALPDLDRATVTDPDGRYVLREIPPGPHHITVRRMGYAPRSLHALVPRDGQLEINVALTLEPIRMEAQEVRAPVILRGVDGGETREFPDRECSATAVRNHPLLSEPDVFQALGGGEVVLNPESPNGVHVRGGAADQTAYLLDGIPVFNPYHAAGVASAWNPDALSHLSLESSAPALASPHALAGTIEAVTRAPGTSFHTQGSLSTTQGRLTLDGPLGAGGAGYLVSLRSGLHDAIAPKDEASYLTGETLDWLAKLETPAWGGRLRLLGYDNGNEFSAADSAGAGDASGTPRRNVFSWHSRSVGAEWRRTFAETAVEVRGWKATGDAGAAWTAQAARLDMAAVRRDLGFAASFERRSARATTGGEIRIENITTSYRIESDSANADWAVSASTPVATLLARQTWVIPARTELTVSAALATTRDEWHAGPGAEIRWRPSEQLTFTGRYARSHQFAQSLRNAESVVGNVFPVDLYLGAGAPGVPVAQSDLGLFAAEYRPWAGVRCGLQAYERRSEGLLLVALRGGEPFSTGKFAVGSGTAHGISLDVAASTARVGVMASYGFQRVRLAADAASYVPEHGARHLLEGGVTVFPTATLSLRLGAAAALGRRTTTASGGLEWEACNLLDYGCEFAGNPHYGGEPLGGTALPAYSRVDLGVRKHWHLELGGRDAQIALFGAATNILGRRNIMTYVRDPETGAPVEIEMRPPSPLVIGLDWRF
jgi:hypothetical protein